MSTYVCAQAEARAERQVPSVTVCITTSEMPFTAQGAHCFGYAGWPIGSQEHP